MAADSSRCCGQIGVGSPGVVDSSGCVLDAPNLGWSGVPLAKILTAALDRNC